MAPINGTTPMKVHVLGSLQTMSYSTHQDRAPVRSIGNINAIDYVQGQRTIAGTMVFAMFHQHWMTPLLEELAEHVSNTDIWSDELPALNLTISMANEYGYKSNMVLYGVKFIDDGGVMSINDLYTENTLQYMATGIQPLKTSGQYKHSYYPTISPFYISEVSNTPHKIWEFSHESYTKEWPDFREILVDINTTPPLIYPFYLTAVIDPPVTYRPVSVDNSDTPHNRYVVNIVADISTTKDKITNIFLNKEGGSGDSTSGVKRYECTFNNLFGSWAAVVPHGHYSVDIATESGSIHHNVWNIEVGSNVKQDNVFVNSYDNGIEISVRNSPIIRGIEDTNVSIISNTDCDMVEVIDIATNDKTVLNVSDNTLIGRSSNKEILIEGLNPDTVYHINTYNSKNDERSEVSTVKTFTNQKYTIDLLEFFIKANSNMLINKELLDFDLSGAKYEYNNIIDSLLDLEDSNAKSELLLLSTYLQNKINDVYNDNGVVNNRVYNIQNILNNTYYFDNNIKDVVVYKKSKTKSYYVTKNELVNEFRYNGTTNTHYYIQPNSKGNKKAPYIDFVCFNQQQQNALSNYNCPVDLDSLQLINNSYTYSSYNNDLIKAIKAAENIPLHMNLLEEPHATMIDDTFIIDVNYSEKNLGEELYLCVASPEEAVNNTPIIKFKVRENTMTMDKYDLLVLKDSYYLLWIQDSKFNNISPPFILSTYKEDNDIVDYHYNKNNRKISALASIFEPGSAFRSYINTAIDIVLAEDNASYKNIEYLVLQALLLLYDDHLLSRTVDDVISETVAAYYNRGQIECRFIQEDNIITYDCLNRDVSIACVTITSDKIEKNSYLESYDINLFDKGYTLLFLIDKGRNITSNVMLINNATKEIFTSNIILEVIK